MSIAEENEKYKDTIRRMADTLSINYWKGLTPNEYEAAWRRHTRPFWTDMARLVYLAEHHAQEPPK
jgi:hypothetical protein